MSDEFGLTSGRTPSRINRERWNMVYPGWRGSPPGVHDASNVAVRKGRLILQAAFEPSSPLLLIAASSAQERHCDCAYSNFTTAIVKSEHALSYG